MGFLIFLLGVFFAVYLGVKYANTGHIVEETKPQQEEPKEPAKLVS
jgi:hypothetical protein